MYKRLFIPGPAHVQEGILQAQAASQAIQAQFQRIQFTCPPRSKEHVGFIKELN